MRRVDSLEKTLMLGGIGGKRRRGWQRMRWLDGITGRWTWVWVNSRSWWWTGKPGVLQFMGSQRVGHDWATELNWSEKPFLHPPPRRDLFHDAILQFPEIISLYSSSDAECNLYISLWILLWLPTIPDWTGPGSKVSDGSVPSSPGVEMEAQGKFSVKVFGF